MDFWYLLITKSIGILAAVAIPRFSAMQGAATYDNALTQINSTPAITYTLSGGLTTPYVVS